MAKAVADGRDPSKTEIRIPWDEESSLALIESLLILDIDCRFGGDNGTGIFSVYLDDADDGALLRLWDELSHLRVKYIDAKQKELDQQEGEDEQEDATALFTESRQPGDETLPGIFLEPQKERQRDQRVGEQEAQKPQVVARPSEDPGAQADVALLKELQEGALEPASLNVLAPLEVELDRREEQ